MTTVGNNNNNMDMFLNLVPPGSEGDPYGNLATNIHGVAIGQDDPTETVSSLLGYSNKDTIGSALDEIVELAKQLNFAFTAFAEGRSQNAVQHFLNTLDPTDPSLPPIKGLLTLLQRMLQSGNLGSIQINQSSTSAKEEVKDPTKEIQSNADKIQADANKPPPLPPRISSENSMLPTSDPYSQDQEVWDSHLTNLDAINKNAGNKIEEEIKSLNADSAAKAKATYQVGTGGNPWLAGNVYVAFLVQFMDLQRVLMKNQYVQGEVELISMQLVTELAKTTADIIMAIAHENQLVHIMSAVAAGISLGLCVGGLAAGFKSGPNNPGWTAASQTLAGMGTSLSQVVTNTAQAATDLTIAAGEGRKEILQAYRTIAQRQMEKAGEAFKNKDELIKEIIQILDKIRDDLKAAVQASLNAR